MDKPKYQKVAAGWKKTIPSGKEVVSVVINEDLAKGTRLTMWPNDRKEEGSKSPDFTFTIDDYKPKAKYEEGPGFREVDGEDVPF